MINFHTLNDLNNDPNELSFGPVIEDLFVSQYNSILGGRINKKSFELKTDNVPIFAKKFNPSNNSIVSDSGIFSINNHFFRTGEELHTLQKVVSMAFQQHLWRWMHLIIFLQLYLLLKLTTISLR